MDLLLKFSRQIYRNSSIPFGTYFLIYFRTFVAERLISYSYFSIFNNFPWFSFKTSIFHVITLNFKMLPPSCRLIKFVLFFSHLTFYPVNSNGLDFLSFFFLSQTLCKTCGSSYGYLRIFLIVLSLLSFLSY